MDYCNIMSNFVLEIWHQGSKCTLYTARWKRNEISETDDFLLKHKDNYRDAIDFIMMLLIEDIGEYGAEEFFFNRDEGIAQALPPRTTYELRQIHRIPKTYPLRLFCYKISNEIIVLFNGGPKVSKKAQDSPDLFPKMEEAKEMAKKLDKLHRNGTIIEENKVLIDLQGELVIDN